MSYRGRPSKGCEACRARKVKVRTSFRRLLRIVMFTDVPMGQTT
jgi:hypothetical protein